MGPTPSGNKSNELLAIWINLLAPQNTRTPSPSPYSMCETAGQTPTSPSITLAAGSLLCGH